MIDTVLARRFIERISQYTEYNINIMDERGIIIASRDVTRVGTFHEIALQVIRGNQDTVVVENENALLGVKKGVNMAIYYQNRKEGVVGVTGEPEEVMSIALIVKMSVEVMLEYELLKYEKTQRRNLKEQLLNSILYQNDVKDEDLLRYIKPLSLQEDIIRIPVLISVEKEADIQEEVLDALRNSTRHVRQDLSCLTREGDILIYKSLDCRLQELMEQYKYLIGEAISDALRYMRSAGCSYAVYVGSIQNHFSGYRMGYMHCMWLKNEFGRKGSFYFYDYSDMYFMSALPLKELQNVYSPMEKILGEKLVENFKEIMEALQQANYDLNETSNLLHVHKNTLAYRMNKIRNLLNMDLLGRDREFISGFYCYLKRKEKVFKA